MDMYDGQGNPVTDYDPAKGRLEMQKRIHHHEAVEMCIRDRSTAQTPPPD